MHKEFGRRSLVPWIVLLLMFAAPYAAAIGDVRYENPRERVLGMDPVAAAFIFAASGEARGKATWMVESGQRFLFGVAGLKTTYLRLGIERGSSGLTVSTAHLSSPVGGEKYFALEPYYRRRGRFVLSGTAGVSITSFEGFPSAYLLTVGVRLVAALSHAVAVGYRVEEVRAAGEERPGVETVLFVTGWRDSPVSAIVRLQLDRNGGSGLAVASRLRLGHSLEIAFGYDDLTGALESSMGVERRSFAVLAGAAHHPVLGVSKSIFLRWGRGW